MSDFYSHTTEVATPRTDALMPEEPARVVLAFEWALQLDKLYKHARQLERELAEALLWKDQYAAQLRELSVVSETQAPPNWFIQTVAGPAFSREDLRAEAQAMLKNAAMLKVAEDCGAAAGESMTRDLVGVMATAPKEAEIPLSDQDRIVPGDEWLKCVEILSWVKRMLDSKDDLEEYNAITHVQQAMNDLERLVGAPLFSAVDQPSERHER